MQCLAVDTPEVQLLLGQVQLSIVQFQAGQLEQGLVAVAVQGQGVQAGMQLLQAQVGALAEIQSVLSGYL